MKPLSVGDTVICQYFNTPERRFIREPFTATIVSIHRETSTDPARDFEVKRHDDGRIVSVWRKEVRRRVTKK